MAAPTRLEVEAALDKCRGELIKHGGNVQLLGVNEQGVVLVRLTGACSGCKSAGATLHDVIEKSLKETLPRVTSVQAVM
ncbi:MAG: NifU family protein [Pseudomonadota bacterium]